jgi:toxin ParE1/3/4
MLGYLLTPRARADLDEIWDYTAKRWSVAQAERYLREIQRGVEAVASKPGLGRRCDEIRAGYYKMPVGSHILFYRRTDSRIQIVRILHQSMDVERHL